MNNFQLPKGIKIGNADDGHTGVTVIIAESGATCGCDVRGGAPGTRETDLLKSEKMMQKVNAIALCGGSAYGLEAACGVMEYLRDKKQGFKVGDKIVPIVPAAVIYDLNSEGYNYPTKEMGICACQNASNAPQTGATGAGRGATVGKLRGPKNADKGGLGIATVNVMGINVTAAIVVNAFGDIYDHLSGKIIAGARDKSGNFLNIKDSILDGRLLRILLGLGKDKVTAAPCHSEPEKNPPHEAYQADESDYDELMQLFNLDENNGSNTTIGCIMTDAKLTKAECNKLASIAHDGLAQSIKPVHTDYDGDTLFCMATGRKRVLNFAFLQTAAVEAVCRAITAAVNKM